MNTITSQIPNYVNVANQYEITLGEKIPATDIYAYLSQIMSLLSDSQHVGGLDQDSPANAYVNAAKVMLFRVMDENRPNYNKK